MQFRTWQKTNTDVHRFDERRVENGTKDLLGDKPDFALDALTQID